MFQIQLKMFLIAAAPGILLQPAAASELSWTPCHRLETGGNLYGLCEACTAQGMGWRLYVSRDNRQTQCRHDSQENSGIYRHPWAEDEYPVLQTSQRAHDQRAVRPRAGQAHPDDRS